MIRLATKDDFNDIARIGSRYAAETILGSLTQDQMLALLDLCLEGGVVLLSERGDKVVGIMAGRFVDGLPMGRFFEEIIWYVEPENRGIGVLLFKRLLSLCKKHECKGIAMVAYHNEHFNAVDKFYNKLGFKEVERKYYKRLGG